MAKRDDNKNDSPYAIKMYAYIVEKTAKDRGFKRENLVKKEDGLSRGTIDKVFQANHIPKYQARKALAEKLRLPILEAYPPDIDHFETLLNQRFAFEKRACESFAKNWKKAAPEIKIIYNIYYSNYANDLISKSLADRMLHAKIMSFHPNENERQAIFVMQTSYIGLIELWVPHLNFNYFTNRQSDFQNHIDLFNACLGNRLGLNKCYDPPENVNSATVEGNMHEALEEHHKNSVADIKKFIELLKAAEIPG